MKLVLDVSAAFAIITDESGKSQVREAALQAGVLMVPDLYVSEAINTAWKYFHIAGASLEKIQFLAQRSLELPDMITPSIQIWEHALMLAHQLDHPVYDCLYLSLALQEQAALLTLDKKLKKMANQVGVEIVGT